MSARVYLIHDLQELVYESRLDTWRQWQDVAELAQGRSGLSGSGAVSRAPVTP